MSRPTMNVKIDVHRLQQLWDIERAAKDVVQHFGPYSRAQMSDVGRRLLADLEAKLGDV